MTTLKQLRHRIEKTDAAIIKKLAVRIKLVKQIGALKAKTGKKVFDPTREKKLRDFYDKLSVQYQIQPNFIKRLFKNIITYSRKLQKK
jgi:chorismate mutase